MQAGQLIAVPSGDGEREVAFAPWRTTPVVTVLRHTRSGRKSGNDCRPDAELTRIDQELETLKETARKSQDNVRLVIYCKTWRDLERVVIVGSGNLAEVLAQAVARSGLQLVQLLPATPRGGCRRTRRNAVDSTRHGWPTRTYT